MNMIRRNVWELQRMINSEVSLSNNVQIYFGKYFNFSFGNKH